LASWAKFRVRRFVIQAIFAGGISARLIEKTSFDAVEDGLQAEFEALYRGAVAEVVGQGG
jgi:hypothetical protein